MEKRTMWIVAAVAVAVVTIACCCVTAVLAMRVTRQRSPIGVQIPPIRGVPQLPVVPETATPNPTPLAPQTRPPLRALPAGPYVEQEYRIGNIDSVSLQFAADLTILVGSPPSLRIRAERNAADLIQIEERGNQLLLSMRPGAGLADEDSVYITLTTPNLRAIANLGSGDILAPDLTTTNLSIELLGSGDVTTGRVEADLVELSLAGSGDISIQGMSADRLTVTIVGSGSVEAGQGAVTTQELTLIGSGDYDGRALASAQATVTMSGSGSATVRVSEELTAHLSGSGDLEYLGSPRVTGSSVGSGQLLQISP